MALVLPVVPPLLATGMSSSDDRARASVPHRASDYGTACRALSPISRTLGVLLLLRLRLLLGLCLFLGLCLLLGWRRRWWSLP